jgi:hypothetical protein
MLRPAFGGPPARPPGPTAWGEGVLVQDAFPPRPKPTQYVRPAPYAAPPEPWFSPPPHEREHAAWYGSAPPQHQGAPAGGGNSPLESLVAQNAMLLQALFQNRPNGLVGLGAGDTSGDAVGGARGAQARDVQRRRLLQQPESVSNSTRQLFATALGSDPDAPQDALEYLRRHGCWARHRDLAYAMTMLAEIWNCLEQGQVATAHARAGLALAGCDQACRDNRWELGFLCSMSGQPSAEALSRSAVQSLLVPHSPLIEPHIIAAASQFVKDAAATQSVLRKGKSKGKGKEDDTGA